jgi:hypothetical protein
MIEKYLIELQLHDTLLKMKDKVPSSLDTRLLLDYHRKTHMIYAGAIKRHPPNKSFINSIVNLHDKFAKEIIKRGMKHNTPLNKI